MTNKKTVAIDVGDVIAIPMLDETYAVGQICYTIHFPGTRTIARIAIAIFACRLDSATCSMAAAENLTDWRSPVMVVSPTIDMIRYRAWPIIGRRSFDGYQNFDVGQRVGATGVDKTSETGFLVQAYAECFWGIFPWDYFGDPKHIDKLLLPGHTVPPYPAQARFKKDFSADEIFVLEQRSTARARTWLMTKWPPRRNKKTIHIQYPLAGSGLPTVSELRIRHAVETAIHECRAGEISDAGGGEGVMDIYVITKDVVKARPLLEKVLADASIVNPTIELE